jgi:hypothetical protein
MINRHFKSMCSALCLLLMISLAPSVRVIALGDKAETDSSFCSTLSNKQQAFQNRFTAKQSALTAAWQTQTQKQQTISTGIDAAVAKIRNNVGAQRSANQAALMAKATSDAQKAAVTAYEQSITSAVEARRSAVDTARSTFRSGMNALLTNHQAAVSGRVTAFQISINDAFSTASSSCTDNTDGATVRASLLQAIASVRQTFESQRTSDTVKGDVQALIAARNQAVRAANNTFLQSAQDARQTLKAAFGDDAGSI